MPNLCQTIVLEFTTIHIEEKSTVRVRCNEPVVKGYDKCAKHISALIPPTTAFEALDALRKNFYGGQS